MKMVLALPYERKDEFKQKYGKLLRWNPEDKVWTWVGREGLPEDLKEFLARSYYTPPVSGGPRLTIELVPKTCWFSNVRNHVSDQEWKAISRQVSCGALNRCQICSGRSPTGARVECHEVFSYHEEARTQKLVSLVALCRPCHLVKHIGWAQIKGHEPAALVQLAAVNGWTPEQCADYVDEAFALWRKRSENQWNVDLSFIEEHFGISIKEESAATRGNRACAAYDAIKGNRETYDHFFGSGEALPAFEASPPPLPVSAGPDPETKKPKSILAKIIGFLFAR
jgi:5-methylcytosine-specific restriction endonuclease McrA